MSARWVARGSGLLAVTSILLVAACGGGSDGGSPNGGHHLGLTVSTTSVQKSADAGTPSTPEASFRITVINAPDSGVSIGGRFTQNGVTDVTVGQTSRTGGAVNIRFKDPSIVGPGIYEDTLEIGICTNERCNAIRDGTLNTIEVTYTVTGTPPSISAATNRVEAVGIPYTVDVPLGSVAVTLLGIDPTDVNFDVQFSEHGLQYASVVPDGAGGLALQLAFQSPTALGFGNYEDTVTVNACAVLSCPAGLHGSPFVITTRLDVSPTVGGPNGYTIREIRLSAADIALDRDRGAIYAATSDNDSGHPNSIVVLDPISGSINAAAFAGSNPGTLAISGGGEFLYAGFWGSNAIRRFLLPGLEKDIEVSLAATANEIWGDIQVVPGSPHSIVATRSTFVATGYDLAVFDDAVQRPQVLQSNVSTIRSAQFGATPDVLYGGGDVLTTMAVGPGGVDVTSEVPLDAGFAPGRIHYDAGVLYTDRGVAVEPVSGAQLGTYPMEIGEFGVGVASDSANDRVFLVGFSPKGFFLRSYALSTFAPIAEVPLYGVQINANRAVRLVRWGPDGLALPTFDGRVILLTGPFVKP